MVKEIVQRLLIIIFWRTKTKPWIKLSTQLQQSSAKFGQKSGFCPSIAATVATLTQRGLSYGPKHFGVFVLIYGTNIWYHKHQILGFSLPASPGPLCRVSSWFAMCHLSILRYNRSKFPKNGGMRCLSLFGFSAPTFLCSLYQEFGGNDWIAFLPGLQFTVYTYVCYSIHVLFQANI